MESWILELLTNLCSFYNELKVHVHLPLELKGN